MREKVWGSLRAELNFLKNCQIQYFFFSATATGAVASFGAIASLENAPSIYLAPLLVILPCWWIFFDKATTISRIVAYLRHLECAMRKEVLEQPQPAHHGWETALGKYRQDEESIPARTKVRNYFRGLGYGFTKTLIFNTTHKYWAINYATFALLTGTCLMLTWYDEDRLDLVVFAFFAGLAGITALHNLSVVGQLTAGAYSYKACFRRWHKVLRKLDHP